MTAFGAFCPFPIRLGEDLSAAEWLRIAQDTLSALRTAPFATMRLVGFGSVAPAIIGNQCMAGAAFIPTITVVDASNIDLEWPSTWLDDANAVHQTLITGAVIGYDESSSYVPLQFTILGPTKIRLTDTAGFNRNFTLRVTGHDMFSRRLNDYDADSIKQDTTKEQTPYAAVAYRAIQGMLGSLYSTELSGLVHAENLAQARLFGSLSRDIERLECNANPATAWEKAEDWQSLLRARTVDGRTGYDQIKYNLTGFAGLVKSHSTQIEQICTARLGSDFLSLAYNYGSLISDQPDPTCWEGGSVGYPGMDLGGGYWSSARSVFSVTVKNLPLYSTPDGIEKMGELIAELRNIVPAWADVRWYIDGAIFLLDISPLDVTPLS